MAPTEQEIPAKAANEVAHETADKAADKAAEVVDVDAEAPKLKPIDDPTSIDFVRVKLTTTEFVSVYFGMAMAILLASLDQTIVSTAIPAIIKDFQALDRIAWIGTGYLLTSTSFAPLYGKFADIFGRKSSFLFAIIVFLVGSVICGIAPSMDWLIVGRAIAGVGGGGIFSLVIIIISDIVSFRDRGKYQGIIGAVFGLSSVIGPLVGGAFTDNLSWRWCFFINIPVGIITIIVIVFLLKFPPTEGSIASKIKRIDFLGTFVIISAVIALLIPLQYGGDKWEWTDAKTIGCLCLSAALFIAFIFVELKVAAEPVVPGSLFENVSVYMFLLISFFIGGAFIGLIYYLPSYFQSVNGDSATQAGLETIPLVGGVVLLSILSGQLVSRYGYYVPFLYFGSVVLTLGIALCSTFNQYTTRAQQVGYLIIAGCGLGSMLQIRVIGIQMAVSPQNIAVATSSSTFFQSLGGSISVAIVGTIFKNVLASELGSTPIPNSRLNATLYDLVNRNPAGIRQLPPALQTKALDGFSTAIDVALRSLIPMAAVIFIFTLFIKPKNAANFRSAAPAE